MVFKPRFQNISGAKGYSKEWIKEELINPLIAITRLITCEGRYFVLKPVNFDYQLTFSSISHCNFPFYFLKSLEKISSQVRKCGMSSFTNLQTLILQSRLARRHLIQGLLLHPDPHAQVIPLLDQKSKKLVDTPATSSGKKTKRPIANSWHEDVPYLRSRGSFPELKMLSISHLYSKPMRRGSRISVKILSYCLFTMSWDIILAVVCIGMLNYILFS